MVDATNGSADERLLSSETLMRNILDTAMDGIISMDSQIKLYAALFFVLALSCLNRSSFLASLSALRMACLT